MLIDTRAVADDTLIQADICIIGAGPAGLTLAKSLATSNLRVVVLESGGIEAEAETATLSEGEYSGIDVEPLEATRVRALGGTSNIWTGYCRMLDENDFERRPWIPYSGWPFERAELEPYYAKAHRIIKFKTIDYDIGKWSARTGHPYLKPAEDIVHHRMSLCRPINFWNSYAADLANVENVRVFTHATVLGIRLADNGQTVDRLDVGSLEGKRFTVSARRYALACGALDNARMLLLSNDVRQGGIGNEHDLVGRFFMEHPRFVSGTLLLAGRGMPTRGLYSEYYLGDGFSVRGDLGIHAAVREREGIANVLGRLDPSDKDELVGGAHAARRIVRHFRQGRVPHDLSENIWKVISDMDGVVAAAYRRFVRDKNRSSNTFSVQSYIEQVPNPDSRVVLCGKRDAFGQQRAHLIWKLTDLDRRTAHRAVELFAQAVGARDLGRIRVEVDLENVFPPSTGWGHHHMGTTRMHDDPKQGVVDRNAKVHGISNLFIAGASVFPTGGCAPPTLTLVALAERLADHLRKDAGAA